MTEPFRRRCRALRRATLVVFFGLTLVVLTGVAGLPWFPEGAELPDALMPRLALFGVQALPSVAYLWALWSVQRALGDLGAGRIFHPTVARAVRHVGSGVLAGSLLKVFAVTNLTRLLVEMRGSFAWFDMSAIVLGVVGAALILLARVVDEARLVQAELDEIL
ncbi:MAG: DUF2975 domain-containing protein [Pseudomonadota bacterium]|nr:DUF2975 domain-containing protein [Pseudomonadota bacterium]